MAKVFREQRKSINYKKSDTLNFTKRKILCSSKVNKFSNNLGKIFALYILQWTWSRRNKEQAKNKKTRHFFTVRQNIWTLHKKGYMHGQYAHEKVLDAITYQRCKLKPLLCSNTKCWGGCGWTRPLISLREVFMYVPSTSKQFSSFS